jgi:hypothetical protein
VFLNLEISCNGEQHIWISDWFIEYKLYALQNVFITLSGAWKLGGFGFAISSSQNPGDSSNLHAFHYAVSGRSDKIRIFCIGIVFSWLKYLTSKMPLYYDDEENTNILGNIGCNILSSISRIHISIT